MDNVRPNSQKLPQCQWMYAQNTPDEVLKKRQVWVKYGIFGSQGGSYFAHNAGVVGWVNGAEQQYARLGMQNG